MGVLVDNNITCEIVIRDGTGEISSATFSVATDPASTNNLTQIRTKASNPTPYIMGVSTLDEYISAFGTNEYKGLITVGSGVGVTMTLTFSSAVDHFTLYFDENAHSMPLGLTVNGVAYTNDDYVFAYTQDTAQTTYTIVITDMNKENNVYMPLMVVGIESAVGLAFDKRNGLQNARLARTYTSNLGMPQYGVVSQEGAVVLFDFNSEIDDLAQQGALTGGATAKFEMGKETKGGIGKYNTGDWRDKNDNNYEVSLGDALLLWQNINVPDDLHYLADYTTASGLMSVLMALDTSLSYETTSSYFFGYYNDIVINYPHREQCTLWEAWQKFCNATNSYVYMQANGKVRIISQQEINDGYENITNSNTIVVPYTNYTGIEIDKINTHRLQNISYREYQDAFIDRQAYKAQFSVNNYDSSTQQVAENTSTQYPSYSGAYNIATSYTSGGLEYTYNFLEIGLGKINFTRFSESNIVTNYAFMVRNGVESTRTDTVSMYGKVYSDFATMIGTICYETGGTYYLRSPYNDYNQYAFVYNSTTMELTMYVFFIKHCGASGENYVLTQDIAVALNELSTTIKEVTQTPADYSLPLNEYISNKTTYLNQPIVTQLVNEIKTTFTGKQIVKFTMALTDLFYKDGNLAYNKDEGQMLQLFDIIEIRDSNNAALNGKLWQVSKIEIVYDGAKFVNVQAVEVREKAKMPLLLGIRLINISGTGFIPDADLDNYIEVYANGVRKYKGDTVYEKDKMRIVVKPYNSTIAGSLAIGGVSYPQSVSYDYSPDYTLVNSASITGQIGQYN